MKTTLKVFLCLALLSTIALADGNQGTGGSPMPQPGPTDDQAVVTVIVSTVAGYFGLVF